MFQMPISEQIVRTLMKDIEREYRSNVEQMDAASWQTKTVQPAVNWHRHAIQRLGRWLIALGLRLENISTQWTHEPTKRFNSVSR